MTLLGEINLVLCRTVDPRPMIEVLGNHPIPDPHSHSVLMLCTLGCDKPVWVGPKQQQVVDDPSVMVGCFICGALAMRAERKAAAVFQLSDKATTFRENIYGGRR